MSFNMADRQDVRISTADDLIRLAENCKLDAWSRDKNVILENDINVSGSSFKYIPIFGGIFDGQGYTISGLSIKEEESYTGLFCVVQTSAVIKNLNASGTVTPSGKQLATGGIAGDNYGMISNCKFDGRVEGYDYTGGIAGYNEESGNISSCTSRGYIMGRHFTGGITGYSLGTINGCTNEARINITTVDDEFSVKDIDVSKYTNSLMNLFNSDSKQDSTSVLNSTVDIGGICGYSQGTIVSCTNEALIGYEHVGYNVGGIVGRQNGYVQLCVNNGEVFGRKDVGGIAGQFEPWLELKGQATLADEINNLYWVTVNALNNMSGNADAIVAGLYNAAVAAGGQIGQTSLDPEAGTMQFDGRPFEGSGVFRDRGELYQTGCRQCPLCKCSFRKVAKRNYLETGRHQCGRATRHDHAGAR